VSAGGVDAGAGAGGTTAMNTAGANSGGSSTGGAGLGGMSAGGSSAGTHSTGGDASGGSPSAGAGGGGGGGLHAIIPSAACASKLVKIKLPLGDFESGLGNWFGYTDDIHGNSEEVTPLVVQPGATGTAHAVELVTPAAAPLVAGLGRYLPCRDVSDYDGISFWAKSAAPMAVRLQVTIPATDPNKATGDCVATATAKCNDHPGKTFHITTQWTQYSVAFTDLAQIGWGVPAQFGYIANDFIWGNNAAVDAVDFSLDEVSLFVGTPPGGPVGN
jgi:hypothetical protein